jgi:outer membrane cobalamin receptor
MKASTSRRRLITLAYRSETGWGCALLLATTSARGQSLEHIEEVVVQTTSAADRDRQRAFATPEATSVVDRDAARASAPQSLADALRSSPSVSVQQTTPGQGTVYVRGLSGRAVLHAVDGVRLNMAFFRSGNNDYLGLIDPYSLTSVFVVPGATSVEYGSDGLGGAVLMRTALPRYGDGSTGYQAFQSFTSNPQSTTSRVSLLHEAPSWGMQAGFTYYQAGPIRPGEGLLSPDPATYAGLERDVGAAHQRGSGAARVGRTLRSM